MSTIVVGVDASQRSEDAIALAGAIAEPAGATLLLATAVPYPEVSLVGAGVASTVVRDETGRATRQLQRLVVELEHAGVSAEPVVRPYDSPPHLLQSLAEERGADMIVVGSAAVGPLGRVLPGTTGERLLAGAPCPVAVAPAGHRSLPWRPHRCIGVGYDGSEEARIALATGCSLADAYDVPLEVIAVLDAFRYGAPALMGGPGYDRTRASLEAAARSRLDAAVATLPDSMDARAILLAGEPAAELADHSAALDLLVVGSRRYGPARAVLLGGVSGRLIRCGACPIVVVPRPNPSEASDLDDLATSGAATP